MKPALLAPTPVPKPRVQPDFTRLPQSCAVFCSRSRAAAKNTWGRCKKQGQDGGQAPAPLGFSSGLFPDFVGAVGVLRKAPIIYGLVYGLIPGLGS